MTVVRIAHVEPRPGRLPGGGVRIARFLVVLADEAGRRAIPVWLPVPDGGSLWRLAGRPDQDAGMAGVPEEAAVRLLRAVGATVAGVEVDVSGTDVDEVSPEVAEARIELASGPGSRRVTALLGYGLALAAAAGAPVRVTDAVMDRLARPVQGDDLAEPFLLPVAARPAGLRPGRRWRFEPRNLGFTKGLDRWDLDGSFLRSADGSRRRDYAAVSGDGFAILRSEVPEPHGSAGLEQTIFADDYRGRTVLFAAEVRTEDAADRAGLFLRADADETPRPGDDHTRDAGGGQSVAVADSPVWTRHQVTAVVPDDADIIRFGVFLAGRGRIDLRDPAMSVLADG